MSQMLPEESEDEDGPVLDMTGPKESTFDETVLHSDLFMEYIDLTIEEKAMMVNVIGVPSFRKIIRKRIIRQQDVLANIDIDDPEKHWKRYKIVRLEICLLQDLLAFFDNVRIDLAQTIPGLRAQSFTEGNNNNA